MINFKEYIKEFSFIKENPNEARTQEMCKSLLLQINKAIKEEYESKYKKSISNYPTDDMIKFVSTNEISTLSMSNILSLIYDESSECFVLSDTLYDEHQRGINSEDFNSLILWTRIFSKQNMIELKEHNKENKYLLYKVLDKKIITNLVEYNTQDLKEMKEQLFKMNIDSDIQKMIDKYDENFIKSKSEKELMDIAEKDCTYIIQNMMNKLTSIYNTGNNNG